MAEVWVWVGHVWTDRVQLVLDEYGDRLTDVSIFGWFVDADGSLTETFDPAQLDPYRAKWPHLRFWLGFRNDGIASIFTALRNSAAARDRLVTDLGAILDARPWLDGIDIDLEQGGGSQNAAAAEEIFRRVADLAHSRGKLCAAALPPLTASRSVGGENWVRYRQLGQLLDHVEIMSYDFAWRGSAPGPVSPGFWVRNVYDYAVTQIPARKISMGLPLYAYFWGIEDYPTEANGWRGNSGNYYAAWGYFTGHLALDGTFQNPEGSGDFDRIGWVAYRDPSSQSAWGFLGCYDWRDAPDWVAASGVIADEFEERRFTVRYGLPAGDPLWSVTDNRAGSAYTTYDLEPRAVPRIDGELVGPRRGYSLTVELLKRDPVAATIIDDYATSAQQLTAIYRQASGSWSHWQSGSYRQYRGTGTLNFDRDFGTGSLYLQARFQFATSGTVALHARGITAEITPAGAVRLLRGTTVLATANVGAIPVGAATGGSSRVVLALRVRDGTARVYFSWTETSIPRILHATLTPAASGGACGVSATGTVWVDHLYLGDGWLYQPREAVQVQIGSETRTLGRIPRTGIQWDAFGRFRPTSDVDEPETRTGSISLDWVYEHWVPAPFVTDQNARVRVIPTDHDVWLGRLMVMDRDGGLIVYFSDAQTITHWRARAVNEWGLAGIALWTLGQEDVRLWEALQGGELPPETKRLNE